jgi:hypothetical protein
MELERLLASRQEVLAMLHPLSTSKVARMMAQGSPMQPAGPPSSGDATADALHNSEATALSLLLQPGGVDGSAQQLQEQGNISDSEDGGDSDSEVMYIGSSADTQGPNQARSRRSRPDSGSSSNRIIRCPNVFAGLNLGLADSTVVALEVGVVEVANLAPRSGWSWDPTHSLLSSAAAGNARGADSSSASTGLMETAKREDLPLPVVYVFCGAGGPGDKGFEVCCAGGLRTPSCPRTACAYQATALLFGLGAAKCNSCSVHRFRIH